MDLASAVLAVLAWGSDPATLAWLDPPPGPALDAALRCLSDLGAIADGRPTARGHTLAALPLPPRLGAMLLEGARLGALRDTALAVAWLSEPSRSRGGPTDCDSDLLEAVHAEIASGIRPTIRQLAADLEGRVEAAGSGPVGPEGLDEAMGRAVLAGWPDRVALRRGEGSDRARLVGGRGVRLDRRSGVRRARLFVAVDVADATPEGLVRIASAVDEDWLTKTTETVLAFDEDSEAVRARRVVRYRDLVLASQPVAPDPVAAADLLADVATTHLHRSLPDDDGFAQLRLRLAFAARIDPDLPDDDDTLWGSVVRGLCPGHRDLASIRRSDWPRALAGHLGWSTYQRLVALAPERLEVPSGARIRLTYRPEGPPVLAVRMQDLFGLTETPTAGGAPVLLHLLAPNGRPQQVTDDLAGFWQRTWPEVRKELRARYPKHDWPEDPVAAKPRRRRPPTIGLIGSTRPRSPTTPGAPAWSSSRPVDRAG